MQRDRSFLVDVLQACRRAREYCADTTERDFYNHRMRQDAVIRQIEIAGEAASRLSPETRDRLSDVPWWRLIGMRNALIHGYVSVDLSVVWLTATADLEPVVRALERHLEAKGDA